MTDPRYYRHVNQHLLNWIPKQARQVLEIGCAEGQLGEAFKQEHPECHYTGVELVASVADIARTRLDRVFQENTEQLANETLTIEPGSLDCLIYGDVLEHLISPWDELRRRRSLLSPGATVLACFPNAQHWSVVVNLLRGFWRYTEHGIMDRTHLRFFTYRSIEELFADTGYRVEETQAIVTDPCPEVLFNAMASTLENLGIKLDEFKQLCNAFQYVVRAKPV